MGGDVEGWLKGRGAWRMLLGLLFWWLKLPRIRFLCSCPHCRVKRMIETGGVYRQCCLAYMTYASFARAQLITLMFAAAVARIASPQSCPVTPLDQLLPCLLHNNRPIVSGAQSRYAQYCDPGAMGNRLFLTPVSSGDGTPPRPLPTPSDVLFCEPESPKF